MLKYIINEALSTIVVIKGLAITVGSKPSFLTKRGSDSPKILSNMIVKNKGEQTIVAISKET